MHASGARAGPKLSVPRKRFSNPCGQDPDANAISHGATLEGRKAPSNAGDAPRAQINGHQWPSMAERKPAGMSRGSFKACTRGTCSTLPTFWHLWHKANRCEACAVASLLRPENGREPGIKITTHMMRHGDGDNIVHDEGK